MVAPFVVAAACAAPPPLASPRADRPHYALTLAVEPGFRRVRGSVRVTFTPNRPTDRLVFRLWPNGPFQLAHGQRLDVGTVTESGHRLEAARPNPTTLVVRLGRTLDAGASVTVALPWTLRVPRRGPDRIAGFRGGLRLGTFFPILAWDPGRGWVRDPAARFLAESATTPAADFDVRVHVPRGTGAVVTGDEVAPGRWHAEAVRDVAVAVARFRYRTVTAQVPTPVRVRVATTPGTRASAAVVAATAKTSLERLSRLYGAYPWRTYSVVVPPDLGLEGIEYPTLSYVGNLATKLVVRHETGHQWFYSLVGNDQYTDPWLDETGATWSQFRLGSPAFAPSSRRPRHVGASISYWERHRERYYYEVYGGGVAALRSLGPPARVDCAFRAYVARNAYGIARPGDLLDALNRVFPGAEAKLRRFGIHR